MSLKLIHTADWHLGQTFYGYDREEEHDAFLGWLIRTLKEKEIDVLLIAGDVFDVANPSAAAQHRFYRFLRRATAGNSHLQIVIIAGNHDSAPRLEAPLPLLEEMNTYVVGTIERTAGGEIDFERLLVPLSDRQGCTQAWCMAVPFLRPGDYPPSSDETGSDTYVKGVERMYRQLYTYALAKRSTRQALLSLGHLYASGAEISEDARSERAIMGGLESVSPGAYGRAIAYTALGHIHKAQRVGGRDAIRYSGSPLPMSFSETLYRHQVVYIELDGEEATLIEPLFVPRRVDLLRMPARPCPPDQVIETLQALPDRADASGPAPFLEVQVLLDEPEPSFRRRVEEALKDKQVRLTSIIPCYPDKDRELEATPLSVDDLQKIDPLDMLKRTFREKYRSEMPVDLQELFRKVVRETDSGI